MKIDTVELVAQLADVVDGKIQTDMPLAPFTSYKIGGPTAVWVAPNSETDVGHTLEIIYENKVPLFILGRGSNILVSDKGWDGVTLYLGENLSGWSFQNRRANVLAGTLLMDLVSEVVKKGLGGLELMAGIPGSVGGALRMNAGAFGQEIEQVNVSVSGFKNNGTPFGAERHEINFNYRRVPELENVAITSAQFQFIDEDARDLKRRMEDVIALRARKQPLNYPSCGSVFKRPPGYYAGALIEESGLKGKRIGGAEISRKHAGFILNTDKAKAVDVYGLIRCIETEVRDRFGVQLEREVKLIGKF
ncbi:MAG: UDP-N-acetylmuramate dehydrogenase [Desulfobacterales bacterium]|jgi:UDP-N-acetylmuramate dehydrogenase